MYMNKISYNENFDNLSESYLFSKIRKKTKEYALAHQTEKIINLGVGDVVGGLNEGIVKSMISACQEYADAETFKGYPPENGYLFLRQKIADYYRKYGVELSCDEIFVSDGAKSDLGNILDIFGECTALIPNPVYPVYVDANIIRGNKIEYVEALPENGFLPMPCDVEPKPYLIYICSPSNPTGAVYDRNQLQKWVDFAIDSGSVIIFDSAYEGFIRSNKPHSVFETKGSENCAIEIGSFSKRAGFTGLRLGYTVIKRNNLRMRKVADIWQRRQSAKFNGVSYLVQKAGEQSLTEQGIVECNKRIDEYLENAKRLKRIFEKLGFKVWGGEDAPYVWIECNESSWSFFDKMLERYQIVGTAGAGFGKCGEGFFRLSAFTEKENIDELMKRVL